MVKADSSIQLFFGVGRNKSDVLLGPALATADQHGYVNQHGLSRKVSYLVISGTLTEAESVFDLQHIFESVKHSLERLQLDYIDVLQCA